MFTSPGTRTGSTSLISTHSLKRPTLSCSTGKSSSNSTWRIRNSWSIYQQWGCWSLRLRGAICSSLLRLIGILPMWPICRMVRRLRNSQRRFIKRSRLLTLLTKPKHYIDRSQINDVNIDGERVGSCRRLFLFYVWKIYRSATPDEGLQHRIPDLVAGTRSNSSPTTATSRLLLNVGSSTYK